MGWQADRAADPAADAAAATSGIAADSLDEHCDGDFAAGGLREPAPPTGGRDLTSIPVSASRRVETGPLRGRPPGASRERSPRESEPAGPLAAGRMRPEILDKERIHAIIYRHHLFLRRITLGLRFHRREQDDPGDHHERPLGGERRDPRPRRHAAVHRPDPHDGNTGQLRRLFHQGQILGQAVEVGV